MILIDTNVLLDVVLNRAPHVDASATLLNALRNRPHSACVSWHTVATVHYVAKRAAGDFTAREFIRDAMRVLELAPVRPDSVQVALDLPIMDFEDAMQIAAAAACSAEYIISRDHRDFRNSPIPVIDPPTALEQLF